MGTSATIKFFTQNCLKETSQSVFVNLDGYPSSIGKRLANAIVKSFDGDLCPAIYTKAPLINCFVAENFDLCHIVSDENHACEYSYDVYPHRNLIRVYDDYNSYTKEYALNEFLSMYTEKDWLYIQSYDIGLCDRRIKTKLEVELSNMIGRAVSRSITPKHFLDNPNYRRWVDQYDFVRSIELQNC